jgi:hemolysin III
MTMEGVETAATGGGSRPLLRGVLHQAALAVAVAVGVVFVAETDGSRRTVAAAVFAGSAVTMLALSASYHRITWSPRARLRMRRVDHAGIYILIAGTYTPVGLLALHGTLQKVVLAVVWAGAAVAIVLKVAWVHAPKWLSAAIAIGLGWVGVAAIPQLVRADGVAPVVLIAAGGLAYTIGGVVYARRRPDPIPDVFGYHELFHALTLVGLALQYAAIALFVVRAG